MKKISQYLISFFIILYSLLFINYSFAYAADLNVDCTDGSCTKSGLDPLFSNSLDGVWYPGRTLTKTVNLKNSSPDSKEMDIKATQTSTISVLDDVITLTISGGTMSWTGSLTNFYGESKINMGTFGSGFSQDYNFTAAMNSSAGNEYQNLQSVFDLTLGFWEEPTGKTSSLGFSCTNSNFDAILELKDNDVAQEGIKVKFTYQGTTHEAYTGSDGKASVGFVLDGEDKETKAEPEGGYPSQTASINSSMCSHPLTTTTGGGAATGGGVLGLLTSFFSPWTTGTGEVAGESTAENTPTPSSLPTEKPVGQVEGTTIQCGCIWWQILLGEIVTLLSFYYFLVKKLHKKIKKTAYFGVIIPILTYLVFLWFNRGCFGGFKLMFFIPSNYFFCKYFAVLAAALYALVTIIWKKYKRKVKIIT